MANRTKSTKNTRSTRTSKGRVAKVTKKASGRTRRAKAAPVVALTGKSYPFTSKREIIANIDSDAQAAVTALSTIHSLDAAMCSQKKLVSDLAAEIKEAGEKAASNSDLVSRCRDVARRYGRRLAADARAKVLEAQPELRQVAVLFTADV